MQKQPIGKLLSLLSRQSQKDLTKKLKSYDIGGGGQHSFLIEIIRHPGVNQDQLTTDLRFDKATTARSVKQLEASGYIERIVDKNDRRAYQLFPTKKAIEFFPTLKEILQAANQTLTRNLTLEEEEQLSKLLKKMVEERS